ncbi:RtcB family protein [Candidatus Woesearchaeota archaeon]|jgi:tRNA-splicing ligase RtcB (3'-phosphate/5'-hydroxy nucleic acid ligase)|nr:RtcB family protein [Candidatus Woesearchaeota archaeon]MBT4322183.1 RtcB family protein [Candidatus Woesearchaeota archaeon]MBT4631203.1 RtcB family protein [Candidatus Woesearchaeota archaeon]
MATKWDEKVKKVKEDIYQVAKEGCMNVPVKIFASEKLLEKIKTDDSIQQGVNMACMPGIQKQSIMMSDAHQGYGFPVGGVAAFDLENGCISPGGIGFDINCGVRLLTTNLTKKEVEGKIKELINTLFDNVPSGVGSEATIRLSDEDYEEVLNHGLDWCLKEGYATKEDIDHCEENGHMKTADASKISPRAKKRGRGQLGTLGAGNHFLEIQFVEEIFNDEVAKSFGLEKDNVVVLIHTGSRGLGHQTCSDYLKKIEDEYSEIVDKLPEKDLAYAPMNSQLGKDYLGAMSAAANYGWCNRQLITHFTRKSFENVFGENIKLNLVYDVAHNIAKLEEYEIDGKKKEVLVHRKGATRSFGPGHKEIPGVYRGIGQPIFIPGSMGTSSWVLVGTDKAMNETFSSAPHGAGRMMSRHEANKRFTTEGTIRDLEKHKIYVKAASTRGITEEAPGAYKDVDEVIEIADTVGIGKKVARLKPMGVVKG